MIIYCCNDLIFATKIRATADALHLTSRPARNIPMLTNRLDQVDDGKANAPVTQVLIDLDLGELAIEMIRAVKTHTPTIPVLAFGPHVAVDLLKAADEAGADQVLPRGAFTAQLPQLLVRA